jgi:hypothetical protein
MKPKLKPPGTERLTLKHDELLSKCAFKFNLRRYNLVGASANGGCGHDPARGCGGGTWRGCGARVGLWASSFDMGPTGRALQLQPS